MSVKERREAARIAKLPKEWKYTEDEHQKIEKTVRRVELEVKQCFAKINLIVDRGNSITDRDIQMMEAAE